MNLATRRAALCITCFLILVRVLVTDSRAELFGSGAVTAENVTIPVFLQPGTEPAALLKAQRIHQDYQRRGFFRIGMLPLLAIEGLRIEIRQTGEISQILSAADHRLFGGAKAKLPVEARRLSVFLADNAAPTLSARLAQPRNGDSWLLTDGLINSNDGRLEFRTATLIVHGPHAGDVSIQSPKAPVTVSLFQSRKPNQPEKPK